MNNSEKLATMTTFAQSGVFRSSDNFTQAALAGQMVDLQRAAMRDRAWVEANLRLHLPELMRRLAAHKRAQAPAYGAQSGLITRNGQSIDLARMRAQLEADNRRLEELRRQVARERGGYR